MLMLFGRDETFISSLKYNNIVRKREINGLNTLEFETNKEVEFGQRLLFKDKQGLWHEYIIIDYFKTHDEDGVTYEVFCEDSTSELYGFFIEDMKPRNEVASTILGRVLEGTRFEVGYVDGFSKQSFNIYRTNVKAAVWEILDRYKAEINVRLEVGKAGIEHRYIDLRKSIGRDVGKRFTYKKDIGPIKKTTSEKDLVTALYGFGKGEEIVGDDGQPSGGYGRKIDFSSINNGKKYVEDDDARRKYGLGKEKLHIFGTVDFEDCEDRRELLELTKEKLKEVSRPKVTYELKAEDISRYEGYQGEEVGLGDIVLVNDEEIDTLVKTRIISIKDNPIEEYKDSEIVLGNFIKDLADNVVAIDRLKSSFESSRNKFNSELERLAKGVKSSYIQTVLDKFNKELNETGGFVYAEEGEGLLILNAPKEGNPTQAINLKGGKIAIANHKNADGSFAYETFGDGDGFTANLIRAGILRGGNVFFNLEDGTFLIGASKTDYSMYWDGNVLHLRDVDIDLKNNRAIKDLEDSNQALKDETESQILSLKSSLKVRDGKIASEISSLKTDMAEGDSNLKSYLTNNYSSTSQTSNMIESKVSSVKSSVSSLNSRLSSAESSIKQTSSEISSKISKNGVISAINQSSESIKIKASKINLDGDVTLSGRFKTFNGSKKALDMNGSTITLYDPKNSNGVMGHISAGSTLTVKGSYAYDIPLIRIEHEKNGAILFTSRYNASDEKSYYASFDINNHLGFTSEYPIIFYQNTFVSGKLKVTNPGQYNRPHGSDYGEIALGSWKIESEYKNGADTLSISSRNHELIRLTHRTSGGLNSLYFNGVKIR